MTLKTATSNSLVIVVMLTLKALANVSPGFALKPWVQNRPRRLFATLKGLRGVCLPNANATLSELRLQEMRCLFPGLPKRNPGLELANAFSVEIEHFPNSLRRIDECANTRFQNSVV